MFDQIKVVRSEVLERMNFGWLYPNQPHKRLRINEELLNPDVVILRRRAEFGADKKLQYNESNYFRLRNKRYKKHPKLVWISAIIAAIFLFFTVFNLVCDISVSSKSSKGVLGEDSGVTKYLTNEEVALSVFASAQDIDINDGKTGKGGVIGTYPASLFAGKIVGRYVGKVDRSVAAVYANKGYDVYYADERPLIDTEFQNQEVSVNGAQYMVTALFKYDKSGKDTLVGQFATIPSSVKDGQTLNAVEVQNTQKVGDTLKASAKTKATAEYTLVFGYNAWQERYSQGSDSDGKNGTRLYYEYEKLSKTDKAFYGYDTLADETGKAVNSDGTCWLYKNGFMDKLSDKVGLSDGRVGAYLNGFSVFILLDFILFIVFIVVFLKCLSTYSIIKRDQRWMAYYYKNGRARVKAMRRDNPQLMNAFDRKWYFLDNLCANAIKEADNRDLFRPRERD